MPDNKDDEFKRLQQSWAGKLRDLHQGIATIDRALALACQQISDPEALAQLRLALGATTALDKEVGRQAAVVARLQPIEPQAKASAQGLVAQRVIARTRGATVDDAQDFEEAARLVSKVLLEEIATAQQ